MFLIGITGPTGAGKTIAMNALCDNGASTLDCDEIYHKLLETKNELTDELSRRFPDACISGKIDRKTLSSIVFNNPAALEDLNQITHKYVLKQVESEISAAEKQGTDIVIISAIALIESGFSKKCDVVVCITAPLETRIQRLIVRDNLTHEQVTERINAQNPDEFYIKNSDYTIDNIYDNADDFSALCKRYFLIDKWFFDRQNDIIDELGQLVSINSVRGKSEPGAPFGRNSREALQVGQILLEKHGFEVSVFKDMIITATLGQAPEKLGILAHLDIVDAGEHWDSDPFSLVLKDGKLFGRGVMDNKGPAIASMYAAYCVRDLFPKMLHGLKLIFGSGEETGFDDITEYMNNKENVMPPNVFSPDSEFPVVNIEKGRFMPVFEAKWETCEALPRIVSIQGGKTPNIVPNHAVAVVEGFDCAGINSFCKEFSEKTGVLLSFDGNAITAKGTGAHASRPELGNNAQTALLEMLSAMPFAKSRSFECVCSLAKLFPHCSFSGKEIGIDASDELSGSTTVNFGTLCFDDCSFTGSFDARTAICADDIDMLGHTRSVLGEEEIEITSFELKKSHHTPQDSSFVRSLLDAYKIYTRNDDSCMCMGGLTYVHDIPGGVAFGCAMPGDDNNVHGANEHIDLKQLIMCAKIFVQAIVDICEAS